MKVKYHAITEQFALAWPLKRSAVILPIPDSLSEEHLKANVAAQKIKLTEEDFQKLLIS